MHLLFDTFGHVGAYFLELLEIIFLLPGIILLD